MKRILGGVLLVCVLLPLNIAEAQAPSYDTGVYMGQILALSQVVASSYTYATDQELDITDRSSLARSAGLYSVMPAVAEVLEAIEPPEIMQEAHDLFLGAVQLVANDAEFCRRAIVELNADGINACAENISLSTAMTKLATQEIESVLEELESAA